MVVVKLRRGLEADRVKFTPQVGELIYSTDSNLLYIGDGKTPGGNLIKNYELLVDRIGRNNGLFIANTGSYIYPTVENWEDLI